MVTHSNWNDDEPKNFEKEHCLQIVDCGGWNDYACDASRSYVCDAVFGRTYFATDETWTDVHATFEASGGRMISIFSEEKDSAFVALVTAQDFIALASEPFWSSNLGAHLTFAHRTCTMVLCHCSTPGRRVSIKEVTSRRFAGGEQVVPRAEVGRGDRVWPDLHDQDVEAELRSQAMELGSELRIKCHFMVANGPG